jgi:hypothetical protein
MSSATPKLGYNCLQMGISVLDKFSCPHSNILAQRSHHWRLALVSGDANMIRRVLRITISASVGGCIHCLVGPFDARLHFVVRLDDESDEFRVLNTSRLCLADHFCT